MANPHLVHNILVLSLVLLTSLLPNSNCKATTREAEKTVLLNIEYDWGKPVALNWSSITYTDQCNWPGINCTDGFVTSISLAGCGLNKPIPKAICSFKNLMYIDLSRNHITGSFPTTLFNCSRLQYLDLSHNAFNGFLPSNIHHLSPNLAYLNLASNHLFGNIPSTISQLYGLKFLYLDHNKFDGRYPPELGNLLKLQVLSLAYNRFAPNRMHPQIGNLRNLKYLQMSSTNIIGEIPETVSNLTQLRLLDLSSNRLNGTIPTGVWRFKNLKMLYLYENSLSGKISRPVEALNLVKINVSTNLLTGQIPEDFGKLKALRYIDFSNNSLSGELPESISSCTRLRSIILYKNQLKGRFPVGIWSLSQLTLIMIQENAFSGSLPSKLGSNIEIININNNRFSGNLPMSAKNLNTLMAENNCISGEIPTILFQNAPLMQSLILANNMLSGLLPSTIWFMWNFKELNLRKNNLSGGIPNMILSSMRFDEVDRVDLSENNLSGPIPANLARLEPAFLNLSSNQLTGQIPYLFQINRYEQSFLSNPGLCSVDHFGHLPMCIRQPEEDPEEQHKLLKRPLIIILILGSIILICSGPFGFLKLRTFLIRQKHKAPPPLWKLTTFHPVNFNVQDILCGLTNNNLVGSGGSGMVYKICLDNSNCKVIAVKKISNGQTKDDMLEKQFQAEIETLGSIRHANIVKLLGCISSSESKLLIYEYMEHGSLFDWLHHKDLTSTTEELSWPMRMSIAIDAARGMCYMHHDCSPPIAHRDVKSSNILLDSEFKAKIADFGLARTLAKAGEPESVSAMVGSFGYMAPEFGNIRKINEKVDVYSFGVVLLELTTGRHATGEAGRHENLAQWAWRQFQEADFQLIDVIDENIRDASNLREVQLVFKLGLICTGTKPSSRPSMKEVLQVLQR